MRRFRIGTRGSPLALAQTREAMARLAAARRWTPGEAAARLELVVVKTTGDRITDRPLAEAGGKGLFIKELEEALDDGRIDLAVHSMKDVPGVIPERFTIAAALPREDARDALLGIGALDALRPGMRVGTTSPRRAAQILHACPGVAISLFRGNVQTRLDKLARGEVDATLLAMAGLNRLGLAPALTPLPVERFLPAAGQGVVGLECRSDDEAVRALAGAVDDRAAAIALAAERACLAVLDGSCRSAIAVHAAPGADGSMAVRAAVFAPDGSARADAAGDLAPGAAADEAAGLGGTLGRDLRNRAAALLG
ncbi:MAG: hydroxymethylbilane synthase [Alphaproteobacteria bacterium]|nr:hydroxymethylbilane synthase [Alphaproteobacteria bacterium]